jgi:hypothetical protein
MKEKLHSKTIKWSLFTSAIFIVLLTSLHFIKPEFDPSWNFISEYEVGKYGWVMQLTFLSLGLSCIFFVIATWNYINVVGKIGLVIMMITSLGMILGGIFKTDPLNTIPALQTRAGKIHQFGALLDQFPFAIIFITISLFIKRDLKINKWLLVIAFIMVWLGFLLFVGSLKSQFPSDGKFGPNVLVGWQNRLMIITQAFWLLLISWQLKKKQNE